MKRPLVWMAVALVLGEVIANAGKSISVVVWILVSIGCVVCYFTNMQQYKVMIWMPACMGVGIFLVSQASKIPALDAVLEENTLSCTVTGQVYWKEHTGEKWKIYIEDSCVYLTPEESFSCRKLLLYVETSDTIPIGSVIEAKGEIDTFAVATNKGQFDARQYYRAKNIDYPVYVSEDVRIMKKPNHNVKEWLMTIRLSLLTSLEKICDKEEFGIFQAVFLGKKMSIDAETKSLYQANGISHILAISGLHISFIGTVLYRFLRKITGSYKWSMLGGVCFLVAYGWMTGFSVSALRAVTMFICMMGAQMVGRTYDMLSAAGLSAIFVLLEYPFQIYEAGFLLTYGAIIGIAGIMPYLEELFRPKKQISKSFLCSFSVQIATLPIMLWFFYTYPIYSIVLNLFVIPFAGYLLFSAMAGSIIGIWWHVGGQFFIGSGHYVLQYYEMLCHIIEKIPFATEVVGRPALWQVYMYYFFVIVSLYGGIHHRKSVFIPLLEQQKEENAVLEWLQKKAQRRYIGIATVITVILYLFLHPISNHLLKITIMDVDQGDCIFVEMPNGDCILIDGGSTGVKNVGTYRIIPYLLYKGVDTLEKVVITHPDADHMNGICELLEDGRIQVKQLYIPNMQDNGKSFESIFTLAKKRNIPIVYAKSGHKWDVFWTCLHPQVGYTSNDTNSYSIMLQLKYRNFTALLTGDAGIEQEEGLTLEPVTVLKVGHHGSQYSSGEQFLSQIQPKISLISCGANNFYGHPHENTIERLKKVGSQIVITAKVGAITIQTDGIRYWADTYWK